MKCQVPGCEGKRHARGLCISHYSRHRIGRPLSDMRPRMRGETAAERMLSAVEFDTVGGCWLWSRAANELGYGVLYDNGTRWPAHRLSYRVWVGEIPEGHVVCHRCDVPACINPAHLFVGTQAENLADMRAKGRRGSVRVYSGSSNVMSRLTEADIPKILNAANDGQSFTAIGRTFGVSRVTVSKIVNGRAWRHVMGVAA